MWNEILFKLQKLMEMCCLFVRETTLTCDDARLKCLRHQ